MRESRLSNELASEFGCQVYSRADYEDDMASFGFYYELFGCNASFETIKDWLNEWRRDHHDFRCGCSHDCCGCSFLQFVTVVPKYSGVDNDDYIVHEEWGRNY